MTEEERFRARLALAGADIPDDLLSIVFTIAGPLVSAIEALASLDLGDAEPFCPMTRLPDDAVS
jgi:hypothetical protein